MAQSEQVAHTDKEVTGCCCNGLRVERRGGGRVCKDLGGEHRSIVVRRRGSMRPSTDAKAPALPTTGPSAYG